jgi:hypothetical protein
MKDICEKLGLLIPKHRKHPIAKGFPTPNYGSTVTSITTSGKNLFNSGRLGPFTIGLDFLKRKSLVRPSSNKDGSKNMYG